MPPAKRSPSARSTPSASPRSDDKRTSAGSRRTGARSTEAAGRGAAKPTAAGTRKTAGRTAAQARSGAATRSSASAGAAKTARARKAATKPAGTTAKAQGAGAAGSARSARAGAKGTAAAATAGAKGTAAPATTGAKTARSTAKAGSPRTRGASGGGVLPVADQLAQGVVKPRDLVMLTRSHIQEALDDAAQRGRVTRRDANDLVSDLVRRGRGGSSELLKQIESLLGRAGTTTKRVRNSDSVDRIARGADRARRAAGVGPSFPIAGYDGLTAAQVQSQIKELRKPELRKVLSYERKHANRKGVVSALERSLA